MRLGAQRKALTWAQIVADEGVGDSDSVVVAEHHHDERVASVVEVRVEAAAVRACCYHSWLISICRHTRRCSLSINRWGCVSSPVREAMSFPCCTRPFPCHLTDL